METGLGTDVSHSEMTDRFSDDRGVSVIRSMIIATVVLLFFFARGATTGRCRVVTILVLSHVEFRNVNAFLAQK